MDPASLNATQLVELVVGAAFVFPFAKWAAGELWKMRGSKDQELDRADESIKALVQRLGDKMDTAFSEVRSLIGAQNVSIRELQIEQRHLEERLKSLEHAQQAFLLRKRDEEDT